MSLGEPIENSHFYYNPYLSYLPSQFDSGGKEAAGRLIMLNWLIT